MPLDVLREKNGLWSASTVKALLSRLNRISAFVVSVAQRWRCGKQRWQTKSYNPNPALSVESYSCLRATGYAVHAIVVSSLDIDPVPKPVYNLQVQECPEYFANGILVHNCLLGTPGVHDDIADTLVDEPALRNYHLLPSVRGDLLKKLGRLREARQEFERAAALTRNARERTLLLARATACAG